MCPQAYPAPYPYYPPQSQVVFPPDRNSLASTIKELTDLQDFMDKQAEKAKSKEKKPDPKKEQKKFTLLETFSLLVLFGPFVGIVYLSLFARIWQSLPK